MRDVLVGLLRGDRRARCRFTGGNVLASPRWLRLVAARCSLPRAGAALGPPGLDRRARHLHGRLHQRGRLVQPVPRDRGGVLRDVGADLRLPGRLLDEGHVARAGAGHRVGDLRRRPDLDLHAARRRDLLRRRAADRRPTWPTPSAGSSTVARRPRPGRRTSSASSRSTPPTTPPSC